MSDISYQLLRLKKKKKLNDIIVIYRVHHRDQIEYVGVVHGVH